VHKIDTDNVVIELSENIHWVHKFSSFDPEGPTHRPYGVHCIPEGSDAALSLQNFPWFWWLEGSIE
jgi:hypothetical protein